MRHLLQSLPALRAAGWKISIWCLRSDVPMDSAEHVIFRAPRWLGPIAQVYFCVIVNLYGFWRWLVRRPRPADVIHATCGAYLGADIATVQFLNCVWLRMQIRLGFSGFKEVAKFLLHCCGAILERLHWWSPALRLVLPVSDSVGDEVRRRTRRSVQVETLPNSYDETRFNPEVRARERDIAREKFGFRAEDNVFVFVSLGHHKRKGFWLAVEGLARVRRSPAQQPVRFLVVGGLPKTLAALQSRLDREYGDWREWITFTGPRSDVEHCMSAADAFLYPSYFEAFCLAEIEAAALGIPLLLTRHHGSEMILEPGVNGLWLDYDPASIAMTIQSFLKRGASVFRRSTGAALTRDGYTARLLAIYERLIFSGDRAAEKNGGVSGSGTI